MQRKSNHKSGENDNFRSFLLLCVLSVSALVFVLGGMVFIGGGITAQVASTKVEKIVDYDQRTVDTVIMDGLSSADSTDDFIALFDWNGQMKTAFSKDAAIEYNSSSARHQVVLKVYENGSFEIEKFILSQSAPQN